MNVNINHAERNESREKVQLLEDIKELSQIILKNRNMRFQEIADIVIIPRDCVCVFAILHKILNIRILFCNLTISGKNAYASQTEACNSIMTYIKDRFAV